MGGGLETHGLTVRVGGMGYFLTPLTRLLGRLAAHCRGRRWGGGGWVVRKPLQEDALGRRFPPPVRGALRGGGAGYDGASWGMSWQTTYCLRNSTPRCGHLLT